MQLNYKCKLQVDQAVFVKTRSIKCTLGTHDRMCMENTDSSRCVNTSDY